MGDAPHNMDGETFEWRGGELPPHPGKPLGHILLEKLREHAATVTKPAEIICQTGSSKTYPELLRDSILAAAGWRSMGIGASDTIAVYTRNNHDQCAAAIGAIMEGITLATMPPFYNAEEVQRLISQVTIRAMLCESANLQVALSVVPEGVPVIVADECAAVEGVPGAIAVPELLRRGAAANVYADSYQAADVGDLREHVVAIVYSSGTTGLPKGVMCTNYAIVNNMVLNEWSVLPSDRVMVTSPMSWITGVAYTVVPILKGATRLLYTYINENDCLDMLQKYKVSTVFIAPARYFLLAGLVKSLRAKGVDVDLSHLRLALTGGAPMTADLQTTCAKVLGTDIEQMYGSSELLLVANSDSSPRCYGSAGKLALGVRARLVDIRTGRDIREPNTEGELRLKSGSYMKGYVNKPEATANAVDEGGWYMTGDLARFDEAGNLHIADRIKEMLKFMSLELTPAEIEDVLIHHPAVKSACVVGRSHEVVGDIPTAFVVLLPGMQATERELQDLVKARLSHNKQLRGGVFFVNEIPITVNGKYDRKVLKNRLSKLPPISDEALGLKL